MKLGMIGLGRMGANMTRRLHRGGIDISAFDINPGVVEAIAMDSGIIACASLAELVAKLPPPRTLWLMLPAGQATESTLLQLAPLLADSDIIVDGGNAYYRDSMRRAAELARRGILYLDVGVSGGVWGLANGYTLTVGGEASAVARIEPALRVLAPASDRGWLHCGPSGTGHYVKMVHNGIEYGLMQAYAEGFALLQKHPDFTFDAARIAENWRHGSVIRSWLLDLAADALRDQEKFAEVGSTVADSGEGRWCAEEAVGRGIPAPAIIGALMARFTSQGADDYAGKLLALLRHAFGGHATAKEDSP